MAYVMLYWFHDPPGAETAPSGSQVPGNLVLSPPASSTSDVHQRNASIPRPAGSIDLRGATRVPVQESTSMPTAVLATSGDVMFHVTETRHD